MVSDVQPIPRTTLTDHFVTALIQTTYDEKAIQNLIFSQANKNPAMFNFASMAWNNHFYFHGLVITVFLPVSMSITNILLAATDK
jgi:hypothetical protein